MARLFAMLFYAFLLITLTNCSLNNASKKAVNSGFLDNDYYEFAALKMDEHDIPAQIMLPNDAPSIGTFKTDVIHDDGGYKWEVTIGPRFALEIEDYGSFRNRIKERKEELASDHWLKITYLVDEKNFIVYKRELIIKGINNVPNRVGKDHVTYHVLAEHIIDGITYEVKSQEEGTSDIDMIKYLAKAAKSMKPFVRKNS